MSNLLKDASILLTPTGYDDGSMNSIKPENGDGDFTFSRNSAATRVNAQGLVENVQIISDELVSNGNFSQIGTEEVSNGNFSQEGSELITNGDFSNGSANWSLIGDVSISNGVATFLDSGSNTNSRLIQTSISIGNSYKVTFEVTRYVNGRVQVVLGSGTTISVDISSGVGTYTIYGVSSGGSQFELKRNGNYPNFDFDIDNVSVKEVGQDWTLQTGWSIGEDKAVRVSTGTYTPITQNGILTAGKSYKVNYTINDGSVGGVRVQLGGTYSGDYNGVGTHTIYGVAGTSDFNNFKLVGEPSFTGSITNISVKEVGQDWIFNTGWSVDQANSKVIGDGTMSGSDVVRQIIFFTQGTTYRFSFTVLDYVSGSLFIRQPFNGSLDAVSANGSYSFDYVAGINDYIDLRGNSFIGSFTNVSVKEITDDTDLPRINYEGFSYQDSLGSELVVNGDFATDSNWVKGAGTTISGGAANLDGSLSSSFADALRQVSLFTVGKTYKVTYTISNYVSGATIIFGNGATEISANGTYTEYITATITNLGFQNRATPITCSIDNVSVKEVLGQEVVPDSGCGSWLLEPQSTNLITYSEDFSNASYSKASGGLGSVPIVTSNYATSPSGEQNADRIQFDLNGGTDGADSSWIFTFPASDIDGIVSIYLKTNDDSTKVVYFRNTFGTIDNVTVNGNWQRYSITNPTTRGFYLGLRGSQGNSDSADLSVWGAQVEQQSYATSYIPTNGATNTRLQDIATNSGNSTLINSTEGVLYAEIAALANDGTSRQISISDSSYTNTVLLRYLDLSNTLQGVFRVGGAFKGSCNFNLSNPIDSIKVAYKYKNSDFALWVNGAEVSTSTDSFSISTETLMELSFDRGDGTQNFFGKNKALAVYKEALTDANLRCLTYPNPVATTFDLDFDTIAEQFTFTRGSEATFVNEQGLIESTNTLTSNLVIDEESIPLTGWSRDGDVYTAVNASSNVVLNYTSGFNFSIGDLVEVSYEVFDYVSGQPRVQLSGGGSARYTTPVSSNGVFTETLVLIGNNTAGAIIHNNTSPTLKIRNFSIKKVITATNTPRIDYSTGEKAFLLEPQSTNYGTNSEQPSTWHSNGGVIVTPNAATSPEGLQNSSLVVNNASGGSRYARNVFYFSSGSGLHTVTVSYFIKYYNNQWVRLRSVFFNGSPAADQNTYFDIQNGVLGTVGANHTAKMEDYGNGWYRCSITFDIDKSVDSNGYIPIEAMYGDNSNTYAANGQGFYAYGSQGEELSYPTSYIPTGGAIATRNQELCNNATPVINSEEGTLYAEISALANDGTFRIISLTDGSTSNRVSLIYDTTSNFFRIMVVSSGSTVFDTSRSVASTLDFHKVAIKYKANDFAVWIDGVEVATDTSGATPIGLDRITFDVGNGTLNFFGNTKGLKIYPKALADVQLEDLTTI